MALGSKDRVRGADLAPRIRSPRVDRIATIIRRGWDQSRGRVMSFTDRVEIYVKGVDGGRGMCSFRREKYVPKGGPNGGDGGSGGSVILCAVAGTDSLTQIVHQKHWRAENGERGGSSLCHGKRGKDLI